MYEGFAGSSDVHSSKERCGGCGASLLTADMSRVRPTFLKISRQQKSLQILMPKKFLFFHKLKITFSRYDWI